MKKTARLTLFALFALQFCVCGQTTSWKGTISSDWNNPTNWTAGVPNAGTDAVIGDDNHTGARQPDLSANSVCKSLLLGTGSKVSTLKADKALTVNGDVTIGPNGTLNHTTATIIGVKGNWNNGGRYVPSNNKSTVAFSGTTQTIAGATNTFRQLIINAGSTMSLAGSIVVNGQLTVFGTLDPGESPSFQVSGTGKLLVNDGGTIRVRTSTFAGNYTTTGTATLRAGTVDYAAVSVNQSVDNRFIYGTLRISGGQTKTLAGNLLPLNSTPATSGNINVAGGTLDLFSFTANRGTTVPGGTITVAGGAILKIGGTNSFPVNYQTHLLADTSTVEYGGTAQRVSLENYGNLTLSSSAGAVIKTMPASPLTLAGTLRSSVGSGGAVSFTAGAALTINGDVILGAGTTFNGSSFAHSARRSWTNDGTFNSSGSVTLSGSGAMISGTGVNNFNDLTISGANVTGATSTSLNVAGNFAAVSAGSFNHLPGGAGAIAMSGAGRSISGTGITFNHLNISGSIATASSLTVAGNLNVSGVLSATAGTITLSGTAKTISGTGAIVFNALNVPGTISTSNSFSINSSVSVAGSLTATGGTATFTGSSTLSGTANLFNVTLNGTKLQLGAAAVFGIGGVFTVTTGTFDTTSTVPNNVNYNSPAPQLVAPAVYHNLTMSGNATKTAAGALTINGDLAIASGTTFSANLNNVSLFGNWINQGTFQAGTSTVALLGSLETSISGTTTFNVLTVNKSGVSSVVHLNNNITVGTLNMSSGMMLTGPNSVTITSDRTGSGIILGTIIRTHPFVPGTPYSFEGPNNTIAFSSLGLVSSITVNVTRTAVPDFPSRGSINRQYAISVAASGPYSTTLRLHYEDGDLNGNIESNLQLWRYGVQPWSLVGKSGNDALNNWVEQSAVTDLSGRWTLSDEVNVARWVGGVSASWTNSANWVPVQGNPSLPPSTNDIAALGTAPFVNDPSITAPVNVKGVLFGSAEPVNLSLGQGGSLTTRGNITGEWTNNAAHYILVGSQTLTVGGVLSLSDGSIGHAINLILGAGSATVGDSLIQAGDAFLVTAGTGNLSIGGDFVYDGGVFVAGNGTVTYTGSRAQHVAGGITYNHLSFDKPAGIATLTNQATVIGNLVVTNAGTFSVKSPLSITKNVTLYANATLDGDGAALAVGGDWNRIGTFAAGNGTVEFNGSGPQSIGSTVFRNLTINKSAGTATAAGNLTINGDLNVASGILDLGGFTANRSVAGGILTLGPGTELGVGNQFPANFNARNVAASSTVWYYGANLQAVADGVYGNLFFLNGGALAKRLTGPTTAKGALLIDADATLDGVSFALEVQGDWTNAGAFLAQSGSVTLSGAANTLSGATAFNDLTVSGIYTALGDVTVNGAMTVSGTYQAGNTLLTLTADLVNLGSLLSSGTITFTGNRSQSIAFNAGFNSSGTVNFNGTVAPGFTGTSSPTLQNVNVNNTSAIAPTVGWVVNGTFVVGSGATFAGGAAAHTFKGDFSNSGFVFSSGALMFSPSTPALVALGGGSFASSGLVVFGGTGQLTLTGGASSFHSVEIANTHPAGVTPAADWVLSGDLTIDAGATLQGGSGRTFTVAGDWSNGGLFNGQTSTVILTGASDPVDGTQISGSTTFNHLVIGGLVVANGDFNVSGNFTHNGSFDGSGATVTFLGNSASTIGGSNSPVLFSSLTVAKSAVASVVLAADLSGLADLTLASGTLDTATRTITQDVAGGGLTILGGATLKIGGTNTLPVFATYDLDPASTVEYSGTGIQTVAVLNYGNLASSSTGARILPSGVTIGITGGFIPGANAYTITGSTIDYNGAGTQTIAPFNYYNLTNSSASARVLGTNGVIGIASTFTPGPGAYTVTGSTVNFNGGAQTIPAFTYHNLTLSGSGTKTLGGNITANGALTLLAGTLADAGFTATIKGAVDNRATITGTGKILLASGSAQHELSGGGTYNILELDDVQGALLSLTNLTVNGRLTFSNGRITTTTNRVIIGSAAVLARTNGHVVGNLQKFVRTGTAVTNTYEIGDASLYAPLSVIVSNVTTAGNMTASTTPGNHPAIAASGVSGTRGVNRYWTMTNAATAFGTYSVLFNFAPGDVDYAANPTNFLAAKKDAAWTLATVRARTATNLFAIGMTNFSDYVIGEPIPPAPTITNQPQSQSVYLGGNFQLSVGATGTGTLTYQWLLNGSPIAGATNSTLPILNAQSSDAGTYSVIVDNGAITTSAGAILQIVLPASIIQTASGSVQVTFVGLAGDTYWVQATTNLNSPVIWSTVATNVAGLDGRFLYLDNPLNFSRRFFRSIAP